MTRPALNRRHWLIAATVIHTLSIPAWGVPVTYNVVPIPGGESYWGVEYSATTSGDAMSLPGVVPSGVNELGVCSTRKGNVGGCHNWSELGKTYTVNVTPGEKASTALARFYAKNGYPAVTRTRFAWAHIENGQCVGLMYGLDSRFLRPVEGVICSSIQPPDNRCEVLSGDLIYEFTGGPTIIPGMTQTKSMTISCDTPVSARIRTVNDIRLQEGLTAEVSYQGRNLSNGTIVQIGTSPKTLPLSVTLKGSAGAGEYVGSTVFIVDIG